jgi:chromosome segregation ATPase
MKRDNKNDSNELDILERIERKNVEELVESVQVITAQLDMLLKEVVGRDDIVEELENKNKDHLLIIDNLSKDLTMCQTKLNNLNEENHELYNEVDKLKEEIKKQQERIDRRDLKITRLEEDVQNKYNENAKLKEELDKVKTKNKELSEKIAGIGEFFK